MEYLYFFLQVGKWYLIGTAAILTWIFFSMVWSDFRCWKWPHKYRHDPKFGAYFGSDLWFWSLAAFAPIINLAWIHIALVSVYNNVRAFLRIFTKMKIQMIYGDGKVGVIDTVRAHKTYVAKYFESKGGDVPDGLYWCVFKDEKDDWYLLTLNGNKVAYVSKDFL